MARPRRYETAAERQQAYRERQRDTTTESERASRQVAGAPSEARSPSAGVNPQTAPASSEEPGQPSVAAGEDDGPRVPQLSAEDLYVQAQLEQTKAYAASFRSKEKKESLPQRLERAEAYARWRFKAFHAGEVASL